MTRTRRTLALAAALVALTPGTTHAATRYDVAIEARAITARLDQCDHPTATVALAYLQTRKGVSLVQMTTVFPYVAYPTEADIAALAARVLPAPRTTNARLLADGLGWLQAARTTLETNGVCS